MDVYPLKQMNLQQAKEKQFALVDEISREFTGKEFLNLGDLGVMQPANKPSYTIKVERILANLFHTEKAILVVGAGTGAIRYGLSAILPPHGKILLHKAPIYPTSKTTLEGLQAECIEADFNNSQELKDALELNRIDAVLIQHTRQKLDDAYDLKHVISIIKQCRDIPILCDDSYAAMKVKEIGVEAGADLSAFSAFKLLGPEGVGVIAGKAQWIDKIEESNYSGGGKVQGWQAMEMLRMLVYAPVSFAIQAEENEHFLNLLEQAKIPEIKQAFLVNAQSRVVLIEFHEDIAEAVLIEAEQLGAAPHPVGAESKYEVLPLFYKISGTFLKYDPSLKRRMIRINPMRSGASTILRILIESLKKVNECVSK